jgi:hypothetical protein
MKITSTILLLLIALCTKAQTYPDTGNLAIQFRTADSIVLISHKSLHYNVRDIKDPRQIWRHTVENGKINAALVLEKKKLDLQQSDDLLKTLLEPYLEKIPIDKAMCSFNPHHTIVLYHEGKISWIDICFDCDQYFRAGDLKFSIPVFREKWKRLSSLFFQYGIRKGFYENESYHNEVDIE